MLRSQVWLDDVTVWLSRGVLMAIVSGLVVRRRPLAHATSGPLKSLELSTVCTQYCTCVRCAILHSNHSRQAYFDTITHRHSPP